MPDDISQAGRDSSPPSFDFDDDAISTLLDTFVDTQTGSQAKHVSRPPRPDDVGAQAAQRSVFQHRSRHEALPLVGKTPEAKQRRVELLEALSARAVGSARARLLSSAAELQEELGKHDAAARSYEQALAADARDVVVLRALRRLAMRREDWLAVASCLEKEAGLELGPAERAAALKLLARVQLSKLQDPAAAEQAAAHAAELQDDDFVARALLASARMARGEPKRAAEALEQLADRWPIPTARALILARAAQRMERAGAPDRAKGLYERVLELQPSSVNAHLGLVRVSRELGEPDTALASLLTAADHASPGLASALRRTATAAFHASDPKRDLLSLLEAADDDASRWTLAEGAAAGGDLARAIEALESTTQDQTPSIRAIGRARAARLGAELGDSARAARWEAEELGEAASALDAYAQASQRLAVSGDTDEGPIQQLLGSLSTEQASVTGKMARADEAARSADHNRFLSALASELEASPPELRGGAALAIAEVAQATGINDRLTALLRAEERAPSSSLLIPGLTVADHDLERSAQRWTEAGHATEGAKSAFAFVTAALLLPDTDAADKACGAALERQADYRPALWVLEEQARDPHLRAGAAATQAELDPSGAAAHSLRAALWLSGAGDSPGHAQRALDRNAPDPLLLEHLLESSEHSSAEAGDWLLLAARASGDLDAARRAAACFGAAALPTRASRALREASATNPEDIMLRVERKDAELRASEFARLADSAMQQAREAEDDAGQLRAFSAMADVDRLARRDMQSARLSLQSIAELRPDHVPTARALEWDALREQDAERIRSSSRRLLDTLPTDSADGMARQRLLVELLKADPDILQADIDHVLRRIDAPLDADPGLARQALGAAYAKEQTSLALRALSALQGAVDDELERGSLALDAARLLQRAAELEAALDALSAAQGHPLAIEGQARLLQEADRFEEAVARFQEAASRAKDSRRAASLWREAARILEEEMGDSVRAMEAWVAAANCDITYLDVYRRLASSYRSQGRGEELAALTDARIEAGADTPTFVGLLLERAMQRRDRGDLPGVIDALRECLELDPHHFAALRELVETHRAAEDWQGATEALIRIARLKRSTDEQVWAFTRLAEVYHEHLDDLPRAEASLRHALQLAPAHADTIDRLASVLSLQGKAIDAARLLEVLVRAAGSQAENRDYRIRLATAVEQAGHARQAEAMLEELRSGQPTEPDVILAIADYYERQSDPRAESMHLNRAINDLRTAIDSAPGVEALWTTLVRVLQRRHGPGPASCAASAAIALGHPASLFEGDVTGRNEALGDPKLPFSPGVDDLVAPPGLPQTARRLFALCEHSFDKVLPFDAGAWGLRRPSGPHRELVEEAGAVAEALGISEPRLRMTYIAPAACMPISGEPLTLVVGGNLHELTTPTERMFLFARALKIASNHLAPALRAEPADLDVALLALLKGHDGSRTQAPDPKQMQDLRKKLIKAVPRRWRDEVESLVFELGGNSAFSTRSVPFAISELGNRAALTLTGDVPSALDALLKIAGQDVPASDAGRLDAIQKNPEAWALIRFAISDAHFEARTQAGVDP